MGSASISPMPGSAAQAADLPAFGGGTSAAPPTQDPNVRLALQNATMQAVAVNAKLNDTLQTLQGLSTTFPTDGDMPKQIADLTAQLQKQWTSYVMTIVKQAPQPAPQQGPVAMQ